MTFPSLVMEDHCHAYSLWKENGIENGICVHVDAHLDLMDRGFTPEILAEVAKVRTEEELQACLTPTHLPWGGVHCGNYLYPAMTEGVVTHLVWVVPKGMIGKTPLLEFTLGELPNWLELTLQEYESLHTDGPRVEGVLAGQRFTLCTSEHLPELDDRPLLLDIDVDYFQDSRDQIWQTPGELASEMGLTRIDALSVAVSVDGGYTCLEHRYLGEVIERVFVEGASCEWEARTQAVLAADRSRDKGSAEYQTLGKEGDPAWFQAALALKQGLAQGLSVMEASLPASECDPRYMAQQLNEALCHLRVGMIDEALALAGESEEHLFVTAIIAFQSQRFQVAKECWDSFLAITELSPVERAFALFIRGQALIQLNSPQEALAGLAEAAKISPNNYQYTLFHGLVLQLTGDLKKAAKVWRKTLSTHNDRLASLGLHLELSRLYRVMGKTALADAELRRVAQKDPSGEYKLVIQLEHLRSNKLSPTIPEPSLSGLWAGPMSTRGAT